MRSAARVQRTWERWGERDALHAVLSQGQENREWHLDEFLTTGQRHMDELMAELAAKGIAVPTGPALDFGCGVGRLSLALIPHFEEVHGVDVAESMVNQARSLAPPVRAPRYHHHTGCDLALFPDGFFAFIVTFLVLQHMPPRASLRYVREFVRVLKPGGIAIFQVPEAHLPPTTLLDTRRLPAPLRNAAVRTKAALLRRPYMEMHMVRRRRVVAALESAGADLIEAHPDWAGGDFCRSIRYIARKKQ